MSYTHKPDSWKGRSLANYKAQHAETAKTKGVYEAFMAAPNLTRARIILWGK